MNITLDDTKPLTALERGDMLRAAVPRLQPGDVLDYGIKDVDLGDKPGIHLPPYTTLVGRGGTIYSQWFYQLQCALELSQGCVLRDVKVVCNHPDLTYPGMAVGMCQAMWSKANGGPVQIKGQQARIIGGSFTGKEYGLYLWGAPEGSRITAEGATFAGKIGACAGTGSGPTACFLDIYGSTITGNTKIATTGGASTTCCIGLLVRGGVTRVWKSEINAIASPAVDPKKNTTMQAAVWLGMADRTEARDNIGKPTWAAVSLADCVLDAKTFDGVDCCHIREGISAWPGKEKEPGRVLAVNCKAASGELVTQGDVQFVNSPPFPVGA